jgi:hypothetical protein
MNQECVQTDDVSRRKSHLPSPSQSSIPASPYGQKIEPMCKSRAISDFGFPTDVILRRRADRTCGALRDRLPLNQFRVRPFDLALSITADPGRKAPLEPADHEAAFQAAVR